MSPLLNKALFKIKKISFYITPKKMFSGHNPILFRSVQLLERCRLDKALKEIAEKEKKWLRRH
jgi:hypothetical protein